jgi:hypothetical protein
MLFDVCAGMVLFLISLRIEVYQLSNTIRLKQKGCFRCCRACYRFTSSITPFYSQESARTATKLLLLLLLPEPMLLRLKMLSLLLKYTPITVQIECRCFYTLVKMHSSSSKDFLHSKELTTNLT